jgi:2,3-dihydroxyphenylpropionate 1,2-dioxygenase
MGDVVAAMAGVHAPQLLQKFKGEEEDKLEASRHALLELGRILDETQPDALLVVGTDHLETFSLDLVPTFTLVTGEEANAEFGGERFDAPVHRPLATAMLEGLVERGFDMAYSQHAELGHAFATPFRFVLGQRDIPVIPLLVNIYLPPLPGGRRCEALGNAIGEVIAERPEKVAILASGGMSHYPGTPRYPYPEFAFDEWIIERIEENDLDPVLDLTPPQLDEVGEGELLTWFVLWGAMGRRQPGRVLSYQKVWHHGQGVVVWDPLPSEGQSDRDADTVVAGVPS